MKTSVITGGAGFIGSHLADLLLARGHRVVVLDDESTGSMANLHAAQGHFDFLYVQGNAADRELVGRLLEDADEVYHLASFTGGLAEVAEHPSSALARTLLPLQSLLDTLRSYRAEGHTIQLFLASSSEVYGSSE